MEPILEQQRRYHEERERLMDAMVGESLHSGIIPGASSAASGKSAFSDVTLSHRDTVNSMHRKVHIHLVRSQWDSHCGTISKFRSWDWDI